MSVLRRCRYPHQAAEFSKFMSHAFVVVDFWGGHIPTKLLNILSPFNSCSAIILDEWQSTRLESCRPGFDSRFRCESFPMSSRTSDLKIGILVTNLSGTWCMGSSLGLGG